MTDVDSDAAGQERGCLIEALDRLEPLIELIGAAGVPVQGSMETLEAAGPAPTAASKPSPPKPKPTPLPLPEQTSLF